MTSEKSLWNLRKRDGTVYKKISFDTLKTWILEARIDPDDYVTNDKLQKWVRVSKISKLQAYFTPDSTGSDVVSSADVKLGWQSDEEEELTLDMTPMIDVTFLLLIFFMVTATFAIHEVKNVDVPKAKHTKQHKQQKDITIAVDAQQRIFLYEREVALGNLKETLKQEISQTLQQKIILAADRTLSYEFIMKVLDEINGAGAEQVSLKLEKHGSRR